MTTSPDDDAARSDAAEVFSHDLLLHDSDAELVSGTRAFVQQGLASGGQVLVHSTEAQVALLRDELGSHPRLTYGLDQDLYQSPTATLFTLPARTRGEPGADGAVGDRDRSPR